MALIIISLKKKSSVMLVICFANFLLITYIHFNSMMGKSAVSFDPRTIYYIRIQIRDQTTLALQVFPLFLVSSLHDKVGLGLIKDFVELLPQK